MTDHPSPSSPGTEPRDTPPFDDFDEKSALGRAIHRVFRHGLHGSGADHGDGDLARAIMDDLSESGFVLARLSDPDTRMGEGASSGGGET